MEARAIIQTKEDGLGHGGLREVAEKWLYPGCILKVEPTRLAAMECERKREVKDGSKTSDSQKWKKDHCRSLK